MQLAPSFAFIRFFPFFLRAHFRALDQQKHDLEAEAEDILTELNAPTNPSSSSSRPTVQELPPPGVDGPLVDEEGYPRDDVDLYRVRSLRGRLAEIQNDFKVLMREIEGVMKKIHNVSGGEEHKQLSEEAKEQKTPMDEEDADDGEDDGDDGFEDGDNDDDTPPAFALVDQISPRSPAFEGGIRKDDLIVSFDGSSLATQLPEEVLAAIGHRMQTALNQELKVVVLRRVLSEEEEEEEGGRVEEVELTVVPAFWEGEGLLGCHLASI